MNKDESTIKSAPGKMPLHLSEDQDVNVPNPDGSISLKYYKLHHTAVIPVYGTTLSACFDLSLARAPSYKFFTEVGPHDTHELNDRADKMELEIKPLATYLCPTGLVFDIPEGYYMRMYIRSSLSWKKGLILANAVGIIDEDYRDQVFVLIKNLTPVSQYIGFGERIAQAELVKRPSVLIEELYSPLKKKANRKGGFGSTGQK